MKVCCGYAFRGRYENRLLIWVLKRALCLKWQMPLWQRISQTLKVEVGFGSSVWSSFFHLKKGPSKGNFSTWHAAFPSVPALQTRKQPMTTEGRKTRKACKTACIPFHSALSCSSGLGLSSVYYHFISFAYFFVFCQGETLVFYREQFGSRLSDTGVSVCVNQEPDFQQCSVFHRLIFLPYPPSCHTEITQPVWCSKKNTRRNQQQAEWNCQII